MNMATVWQAIALIVMAFSLSRCGGSGECMTVSQVAQNAESLDGERICVRGGPDFRFVPYHPMQKGGCPPAPYHEDIGGELDLVDEGSPDLFKLSIGDLLCEGSLCAVACSPFSPGHTARHDEGPCEEIEAFEFVGVLRVDRGQGEVELTLEDLDLNASRRLVDGEWGPIPTGVFEYWFP
jgi:hypothetical protein